jgi:hypothetical protein
MSPILAIFGTIALLIGHAPASHLPTTHGPQALATAGPSASMPLVALTSHLSQHDDPVRESASLEEQSFEQEDNEDSTLDGVLSPNRPATNRFTLAQLLTATRERLDGSSSDRRSTCLRC